MKFGCNIKITISKETPPSSILYQLSLTKGDRPEKRRDYYLKKSHLAVFCIDRTAIGCYDRLRPNQLAKVHDFLKLVINGTSWKISQNLYWTAKIIKR